MLKSHLPLLGVALLGVASLARADMIYTLNLGGSCCRCGTFGSITLHSIGADTVMVTETLIPGNAFAVSGAGASLEFTVDEAFTYVPGTLTTGLLHIRFKRHRFAFWFLWIFCGLYIDFSLRQWYQPAPVQRSVVVRNNQFFRPGAR